MMSSRRGAGLVIEDGRGLNPVAVDDVLLAALKGIESHMPEPLSIRGDTEETTHLYWVGRRMEEGANQLLVRTRLEGRTIDLPLAATAVSDAFEAVKRDCEVHVLVDATWESPGEGEPLRLIGSKCLLREIELLDEAPCGKRLLVALESLMSPDEAIRITRELYEDRGLDLETLD